VGTSGKRRFFVVRVSILLFILFCVVLYAIRDVRSRRARNDWERTLDVAIVLVHVAGAPPVEVRALNGVKDRVAMLDVRLEAEKKRYRSSGPRPFAFHVHGPVEIASPPPAPDGEGTVDLAKQAWALSRWLGQVDPQANVNADHYDARIYVLVKKPTSDERTFFEGRSEQGGRIGMVEVDLDGEMADVTLAVAAHELMHTLGATDKYDEQGRARVPSGLAEPSRAPLYPQALVEIMARNRPVSPREDRVLERLEELAVGPATAQEIGWVSLPR
jgi:hypothetical protein